MQPNFQFHKLGSWVKGFTRFRLVPCASANNMATTLGCKRNLVWCTGVRKGDGRYSKRHVLCEGVALRISSLLLWLLQGLLLLGCLRRFGRWAMVVQFYFVAYGAEVVVRAPLNSWGLLRRTILPLGSI